MWWPCGCGSRRSPKWTKCYTCGVERPNDARHDADTAKPSQCATDGALLDPNGFCHAGHGFAPSADCPFTCPFCRHPLAWSGACEACHGCTTGRRDDWTFPGQRYDFQAGHWRPDPTAPAGQPACAPEDNAAAARAINRMLGRLVLPES
jgi:hypothetical protein